VVEKNNFGNFFGFLSEVASTECKMSEVALLAPTYEYGYVGVVGLFYHSGSIITRGWVRWKGKVRVGTICFMYVSCMFRFLVVRIAGLSESLKAQRTQKTLKEEGMSEPGFTGL